MFRRIPQVFHGPGKVTERVTERVFEKVTEGERIVLELLEVDPGYTYATMADLLKISRKTVSERIKKLKEKGVIERVGSDTKGYWKIHNSKYLVEDGEKTQKSTT